MAMDASRAAPTHVRTTQRECGAPQSNRIRQSGKRIQLVSVPDSISNPGRWFRLNRAKRSVCAAVVNPSGRTANRAVVTPAIPWWPGVLLPPGNAAPYGLLPKARVPITLRIQSESSGNTSVISMSAIREDNRRGLVKFGGNPPEAQYPGLLPE
ncbi:hypothetical protein BDZ89DRAFT_1119962 [Hymenopellis radicata]|nr:hypothetical protein BDZ89DRAFT_1119962 [Hymenopellis radicata]